MKESYHHPQLKFRENKHQFLISSVSLLIQMSTKIKFNQNYNHSSSFQIFSTVSKNNVFNYYNINHHFPKHHKQLNKTSSNGTIINCSHRPYQIKPSTQFPGMFKIPANLYKPRNCKNMNIQLNIWMHRPNMELKHSQKQ